MLNLTGLNQQISAINLTPIQNKLNEHDALLNNQTALIGGIEFICTIKYNHCTDTLLMLIHISFK